MLNKEGLVARSCCGIDYLVNPYTPSDVFFQQNVLSFLIKNHCDLSVAALSNYLRSCNNSYSPIILSWDMTSRCNFSCPFCYIQDNSTIREVNYSEAVDVIDSLVSEGLFEAYLSGGECLLLKDFIKIYTHLKKRGVFVTVFSNGSIINNTILECWEKLPPSSVEITIYDDNFSSSSYKNVLELQKMGIHVILKFTLTNKTLVYYNQVKLWAKNHNLFLGVDANIFDGKDERHSNLEKRFSLSSEEKKKYLPNKYKNIKSPFTVRTGFPCKTSNGGIHIDSNFTMSLCRQMNDRWDLRAVDVHVAISELRKLINKYKKCVINNCDGCSFSKMCSMCYANAEIVKNELFVPDGYCDSVKKRCLEYY